MQDVESEFERDTHQRLSMFNLTVDSYLIYHLKPQPL